MKLKTYNDFLIESTNSKPLVIVDIQPSSEKYINFNLCEFGNWARKFSQVYCFYNDEEVGMDNESDMYNFYSDECCVSYDDLDTWTFLPKQYAWFRDVMDTSILSDDEIEKLLIYMIKNRKYDIRDFKDVDIKKSKLQNFESFDDQFIDDYSFYVPDQTLDDCKSLPNRFTLCGGGGDQCLKEMKFLFDALNKKYKLENKYVYW